MTPVGRSKAAALVAAAAAAALLAACSSSAGGDSGGSSASSATSSAGSSSGGVAYAKAQLAKFSGTRDTYGTPAPVANVPSLKGKTIWYVPIGTGVPVLATIGAAMQASLHNLGATVHVCDGKFTPAAWSDCLNTAATQGANAVVTGFIPYQAIPTAFQNLVKKGIPVLVGGESAAGIPVGKKLGVFDPSGLTQQAFRLTSDAAIADSNGKADVLYVNLTDSPLTANNTKVAIGELAKNCSGCKSTSVNTTTASAQTNLASLINAKLAGNPDIDYLVVPQDAPPFLPSAQSGVKDAGRTGKVKIIAPGGTTLGLNAVKAGQMAYDIGQGAWYNGWAFADAAVRLLAGAPIPPGNTGAIRVFTSGNVAGMKITDADYASSTWYGGDQWQQQFLSAWAGK